MVQSGFGASSPGEAVAMVIAAARAVSTERIPLDRAGGRVLAEPVAADRDSPAVDVSAMDGYALRLADLRAGRVPVAADILIGREPPELLAGAALRIVTGACVPTGADAVIKREDVSELPGEIEVPASVIAAIKPGQNIRRRAENAWCGQVICTAGVEITAPVAGALASFGVASPAVFKRVRCAILVTGDELLDTSQAPAPWQIRDSNQYSLRTLLSGPAWLEVVAAQRERDDPTAIASATAALLAAADAVFLTGGVSMGDRDFVPGVIRHLGGRVLLHKVPQRPGRPVLCAISADGKPIFALPGNPVSVMVTARRMAAPVLRHMAGLAPVAPTQITFSNADDRTLDLWWHRSVRCSGTTAELTPTISSGDVAGVATSTGFVEIPPHSRGPGPWDYYPWTI